ncbi:hypothetical protein ACCI51_18115 [Microbulbifer echini]|uniref:Uncharacterized protein n=1 Tax=Microbulbifer echini TaxID=1529067 RepID=A0ABV4NST4_9GAMM
MFSVPKVSCEVIGQGESLTLDIPVAGFDESAATAATGDITGPTAFAAEAAGAGSASLAVKFTGVPGTVKT